MTDPCWLELERPQVFFVAGLGWAVWDECQTAWLFGLVSKCCDPLHCFASFVIFAATGLKQGNCRVLFTVDTLKSVGSKVLVGNIFQPGRHITFSTFSHILSLVHSSSKFWQV